MSPSVVERVTVAGREIETFALVGPDGREIAFLDLNPAGDRVLFHCHGGGSSRYEALLALPHAERAGIRVVAADRGGYGHTAPITNADLRATGTDVPALAALLGIRSYALSGWSAGGPTALAAALCSNGAATRIVAINSAADRAGPAWRTLPLGQRLITAAALRIDMSGLFSRFPGLLDRFARRMMQQWCDERPEDIETVHFALGRMFREGMRQGAAAFRDDAARIYGRAWGFDYASPGIPVTFLHGLKDPLLPYFTHVAAQVPMATLEPLPGGHLDGGRGVAWRRLFEIVASDPVGTPAA